MPTRLEALELMVSRGVNDAFPLYGLALEYRSADRAEDALRTFNDLRARFPAYVPQYLMAGQLCQKLGRKDDARDWLSAGVAAAQAAHDGHALGELESALAQLG